MRVIDFKDAKCRHCYKCVRHCAVKAISVRDEQARIMVDHCINCGRCLEVCPQNAKTFSSDLDRVKGYLRQCSASDSSKCARRRRAPPL